jgi:hypothetical protein
VSRHPGRQRPERRNQPRTVEAGRPTTSAALRCPAPAAACVNAAPITATVSTRRASTPSGSNTCVDRHNRHRARRGRNLTGPASDRTTRQRANPQPYSIPPHYGHPTKPDAKSLSTRSESLLTVNTVLLRHHSEDPLMIPAKESARRSLREQNLLTLSLHHRHHKHQPRQPRPGHQCHQAAPTCSTSVSINTGLRASTP